MSLISIGINRGGVKAEFMYDEDNPTQLRVYARGEGRETIELPEYCSKMSPEGLQSFIEHYYRNRIEGLASAEYQAKSCLKLIQASRPDIETVIPYECYNNEEATYHLIDRRGRFAGVYLYNYAGKVPYGYIVEMNGSI